MQARITVPLYKCAPEGHTVLSYPMGTVVSGIVARLALADNAAEAMGDALETKVTPPPEAKASEPVPDQPKRRGRPPRARADG